MFQEINKEILALSFKEDLSHNRGIISYYLIVNDYSILILFSFLFMENITWIWD